MRFAKSSLVSALFFVAALGCRVAHHTPDHVVTVWAHEGQPAEKHALAKIVADFNRQSAHQRIDLQFKQEQGYSQRVYAAAIARLLPDILDVDAPYTAEFAENGMLTPLDELLPQAMLDDFYAATLTQGKYQNRLYTLGAFESTIVLFYNRNFLDACQIPIAQDLEQAWEWPEFLEHLRRLKQRFPQVLPLETFMPWGGEWLTYAFLPVLWSNGARVMAAAPRDSCTLDSPESAAAFSAWQSLFQAELASASAAPGRFVRGEAATAWGIFNLWPALQASGLNVGMMPLPRLRVPASPMGSWRWGIASTSTKKSAAALVLRWLLDAQHGVVPMCEANGGIPARRQAAALMPDFRHTRALYIEQLENSARPRPVTPAYGTITLLLAQTFSDIAYGAEVPATVRRTAAKMQRALERH